MVFAGRYPARRISCRFFSNAVVVTVSAVIGGLLALLSDGLAGGGHGSAVPAMLYLGLGCVFLDTSFSPACVGAVLYAAYACVICTSRGSSLARACGGCVVAAHYSSVVMIATLWWTEIQYDPLGHLNRSLTYGRIELFCSASLFVIANAMAILLPFGCWCQGQRAFYTTWAI